MTLEESIAQLKLGLINISMIPAIAMKAFEEGAESESLIILSGMNDKDYSYDIELYLNKAIDELKVKNYKSDEAIFILANYYVNQVIENRISSIQAISEIKHKCWEDKSFNLKNHKYLFDSVSFESIISDWYNYYEINVDVNWKKTLFKSIDKRKKEIEDNLKSDLIKWQKDYLEKKITEIKNEK